ncbi:neuronal growth regulator 1 isoform X1 [Marmota monax]|uniref:neuronal growth regulator 1 isoform X2 n=1 Tax=Ictidomys tridecemlineatus TaxID=43179 RepID=UPI000B54827F|nr:neuronal growth regulator 1 isoform X2 [Ictidomys tridecemlineatus]XP_046306957.1 neuronal growth regulator 1 isoform X1 [Marmota monax]KAG3283378.1 neuronal growth regulator 1, transcript variant X1 [Ictidomys tridecemlineatus]
MDMMLLVQGACCSNQWLAAVLLSLCCLLPSCLPAGQSVDFPWATVDNMMVRKGDTAVLRCYLEDGASKGAWLNRSSIIFAGGDKWSVDPRVSISTLNKRDYSLQIQNVDVTDDGPYTCSVQTQHTPRTMQVHLTVQVPPKIYDISSDMTINEGTNVTLTCLATGKPEPSISWRHISPSGITLELRTQKQRKEDVTTLLDNVKIYDQKRTSISQSKSFENGQYLDIYGITRDQAGEYECSAENDVSFSDVKKVKVVVNFAPTIQEIKSGTVIPGRSGLIRCEGAGVPPPAFEWYKGEKKLFNGQQGIIIQNFSTRSILTVTNVTQEHFGNYTCVAANKLGTTNASLPLNPPSTAQYGITGSADVLFSCWYLVLTLSSFTSIFYLKNAILQ